MNSNVVFTDFSENEFQTLKDSLKKRFSLVNKTIQQGTKEALVIDTPEGKINLIYYNNGKLMIQSSPSNSVYASVVDEISSSLIICFCALNVFDTPGSS